MEDLIDFGKVQRRQSLIHVPEVIKAVLAVRYRVKHNHKVLAPVVLSVLF